MPLKILLTADVHLGMKFASYPEVQKELSEARFETLKHVVHMANEHQCDLLVVAGDLFDHLRVADRDILRATQIVNEFQGKLAVVLPGNHDFIVPGESKVWQKFKTNAGDRVLLLEQKKIYSLNHYDLDANLYAAPCDAKHSDVNHIGWIRDEPRDSCVKYHIGIAHGSLLGVSPDPDQKFYPMAEDELLKCGLDLWLMGHTDRLQYPTQVSPLHRIFYPGTPEPNGFDCEHDGRVWIIQLDDEKKITATSIRTGKHRFLHRNTLVSTDADLDSILKEYSSTDYSDVLLKLRLDGRLPKDAYANLQKLRADLEKHLLYVEVDTSGVKQAITAESINREFTESSFPHRLLTFLAQDAQDNEPLQIAYDLIQELRK